MRPTLGLGLLAALVACSTPAGGPVQAPAECEVGVVAPPGYQPLEVFREPYADHVGVRRGFIDRRGRELHGFAGIPGEFGEGLPAAGRFRLPQGGIALLSGSGRVWVAEWQEGDRCDPRAALGNGFGREGFLRILREALIAAGSG